jgi:hypothetical protein
MCFRVLGQPRRQASLRRPAQQLQQVGASRCQRKRRPHCQDQAQVVSAHRRGERNLTLLSVA